MGNNTTKRFAAFHKAFIELKGSMSTREFSEKLGMANATVGYYATGERIPDALGIARIAEVCGVSADWLLGLSSVKERDADLQAICDYTGLSPEAIEVLQREYADDAVSAPTCYVIEKIILHPQFNEFMKYMLAAFNADYLMRLTGWGRDENKNLEATMAKTTADLVYGDATEEGLFSKETADVLLLTMAMSKGATVVSLGDAIKLYTRVAIDFLSDAVKDTVTAMTKERQEADNA